MKKKYKNSANIVLKKGDIIDVIAPGYALASEDIQKAKDFLLSWGLVPRVPHDLQSPHFLHSNDDEKRFYFLKKALLSKDSKVIWCLRGGYGSNRLLPYLKKMKKPQSQKLLIGLSDVTSLHNFINTKWNWKSYHGNLLDRLGQNRVPKDLVLELKNVLFGHKDEVVFKNLVPLNEKAQKVSKLKGEILGGNLITFQSLIGTPFEPQIKGKFLFFEDIGERGYRLDRVLVHLEQAGLFKNCLGVLFGDFTLGNEPDGTSKVEMTLKRFSEETQLPVWGGVESGHGVRQRLLPFNTTAILVKKTSSKFELKVKT